ncbi:hypothetical protein LZ32DRAFT_436117 [Colletotrichum eremochloae]|nr:hypothetical protein LZ32DRAFT_436117 [Colletotrichum eremochloae]
MMHVPRSTLSARRSEAWASWMGQTCPLGCRGGRGHLTLVPVSSMLGQRSGSNSPLLIPFHPEKIRRGFTSWWCEINRSNERTQQVLSYMCRFRPPTPVCERVWRGITRRCDNVVALLLTLLGLRGVWRPDGPSQIRFLDLSNLSAVDMPR